MSRHFSRKRDLKKFNRRKRPCRKRTMKCRRLLEDIQAEEYLRLMKKKPRKAQGGGKDTPSTKKVCSAFFEKRANNER